MAENFTVYSFQLRPDDFTKFQGGVEGEDDTYYDDEIRDQTFSEDEYSGNNNNLDIFSLGGLEKQDMTNPGSDTGMDDTEFNPSEVFNLEEEEEIPIFDVENVDFELDML